MSFPEFLLWFDVSFVALAVLALLASPFMGE
jgi:hypothetical protein